jgi:hypothetical protein
LPCRVVVHDVGERRRERGRGRRVTAILGS